MIKKVTIFLILCGLAVLFFIDPEQSVLIPKCPFYWLTGFECPACGTQRAIHQLLHFQLKEAFGYNPFLLISMPYLAILVWVQWFDPEKKFPRLKAFAHSPYVTTTYLVLIILWWIGRNLIHFL